jgi:predicted acetyltransferase
MVGADARLEGTEDLEALSRIISWAFGFPPPSVVKWLTDSGLENVRVLREGKSLAAGLLEIPMAHWFGGESVPTVGIAGVGVDPSARGKGLALRLMQACLRDARDAGVALSSLYPATVTLYRAAGYEIAGHHFRWSVRPADCPRVKNGLELSPIRPEDDLAIEETYRSFARSQAGYLDRGPYVWNRVRAPMGENARGFVVRGEHGVEGYVYLSQQGNVATVQNLQLSDLVALTPAALSSILTLLFEHRSMVERVQWQGPPSNANLYAFPEKVFSIEMKSFWMLRVVHVERALTQRGYPPLDLDVKLRVEDDLLRENTGTYRLALKAGRPSVEVMPESLVLPADAEIGVRALASLYTGFMTPSELARAGLLRAGAATQQKLALLFGGPAPALADFF